MVYDSRLQRGVQDRSFTPIKVAFHKDSTHEQMLSKCVESVWKDAPQNSNFFLSDGSGSSITSKNFEIDLADGTKEIVSWSLANYLRVACIRYPSRARLYCVRIPPEHLDSQLLVYRYYVYKYTNCLN